MIIGGELIIRANTLGHICCEDWKIKQKKKRKDNNNYWYVWIKSRKIVFGNFFLTYNRSNGMINWCMYIIMDYYLIEKCQILLALKIENIWNEENYLTGYII